MDIRKFIQNFESAFEGLSEGQLVASTEFRTLDSWDSVTFLNILAMVDLEYGVQLNRQEMNACRSVQDVFELVKKKTGA